LRKAYNSPEVLTSIEENLNVIDEAVDQVRDLSVDLRPLLLDDFGLVVAVRWYLDRQAKNSGVAVEFASHSLHDDDRFPAALETACFRIVQEGVTNIIRHARATRLSVQLERSGSELLLVIGDNGSGFDVNEMRSASGAPTLGLRGMEERAQAVGGTLTIDSTPSLGTQICASFPVPVEELHEQMAAFSGNS
jgi:signal transduction histidine kinase